MKHFPFSAVLVGTALLLVSPSPCQVLPGTATFSKGTAQVVNKPGEEGRAFASMRDLQRLSSAEMSGYGIVALLGYYSGNPSGGAQYNWLDASEAADLRPDGGLVIAPSDHPGTCSFGCLQRAPSEVIDVAIYGAAQDQSPSVNTAAFRAALSAAARQTLPPSSIASVTVICDPSAGKNPFRINATLVVNQSTTLSGTGGYGCRIRADPSFDLSDPWMVRLGSGTGAPNGMRVNHITLDANQVSGLGGFYSNNMNEGSGGSYLLVENTKDASAIKIVEQPGTDGPENWAFDHLYVFPSVATSGPHDTIDIDSSSNPGGILGQIDVCTVTGPLQTQSWTGLNVNGAFVNISRCHMEDLQDGIYVHGGGSVQANATDCDIGYRIEVRDCIHIGADASAAMIGTVEGRGPYTAGTALIKDDIAGSNTGSIRYIQSYQDARTPVAALVRTGGTGASSGLGAAKNLSSMNVLCQVGLAKSITGSTGEMNAGLCPIPAGALGKNGCITVDALWTSTKNSDNKGFAIRFGPAAGAFGTSYASATVSTSNSLHQGARICNAGAATVQIGSPLGGDFWGSSPNPPQHSVVNTNSVSYVSLNGNLANPSDSITLEQFTVSVTPSAGN